MTHSFEELQLLFNKELGAYSPAVEPNNLQDPVTYTLGMGGKRLRPVLLLMAAEAFGGKIEHAMPAALAIEIFHNSTLIHDDIMDHADVRRNQPTVHKEWNVNTAILSGDLMIIKASEEISKIDVDKLKDVLKVYNKISTQVCEGQQYDLNFETDDQVTISDYMKMIRLKTSVLLAGALQIGAIIGGASVDNAKNMYCFGENLGLAFQLQDDLLDAFGDLKTFGKKIGGDIVANKKTFLLLKALEIAQGAYRDELTSLINKKDIKEDEKISGVLDIYNSLNIKAITEDFMLQHFNKAFDYLGKIDIPEQNKETLKQIAENLVGRKS
ncbi:MAG: isoprenyl synthetase [Salinivirgaceae bacterium]|nr:MAG: isoprenyl synthetase [Salinivirgaceae bacterium]